MLPEVDSIYFLSDGAPLFGHLQEWGNVQRSLKWMTRHYPIAIYMGAFTPSEKNARAMIAIAEAHQGLFEVVQE